MPYGASNQNAASSTASTRGRTSPIPGYLTPTDGGAARTYYYTARDAFRTEGQRRTDFAANYSLRRSARAAASSSLFVQAQVINLFNQFQLCGCGATVFRTAATSQNESSTPDVRTNVTHPTSYTAVQPVHDRPRGGRELGQRAGLRQGAEPLRLHDAAQFRIGFGVRF